MARVVVMGVMGCGKSTVGTALGEALGIPFVDGDDFHSDGSVGKMAAGIPLEDEDRWPWLADVAGWLESREAGVIACSALKRSYRDAIREVVPDALFVHLVAPREVLAPRVEARRDRHHAASTLLDSQFATLEPLEGDELGTDIDVENNAQGLACSAALKWIEGEARG